MEQDGKVDLSSLITAAVRNDDVPALSAMLKDHPERAFLPDWTGCTPLHYAAMYGNVRTADFLLAARPDAISFADGRGWTPLAWSAARGHRECTEMLLNRDPQAALFPDDTGLTPIHAALRAGNTDIVRLIISRLPEAAMIRDDEGWTLLHWACALGRHAVRDFLIRAFPDLTKATDKNGRTPAECSPRADSALPPDLPRLLEIAQGAAGWDDHEAKWLQSHPEWTDFERRLRTLIRDIQSAKDSLWSTRTQAPTDAERNR